MVAPMQAAQIVQTAYYVPDAEAAAAHWAEQFGAGPFFLMEHIALRDVIVRGAPSQFDHTSAYGWCGNLMVELVQQNCSTPSIFNDRAWGLHHLAHFVDSLPAAIANYEARGAATAMEAITVTGTAFAFVDTNVTHGHYFELYEHSQVLGDFYDMVRQAASGWRGEDPVRGI